MEEKEEKDKKDEKEEKEMKDKSWTLIYLVFFHLFLHRNSKSIHPIHVMANCQRWTSDVNLNHGRSMQSKTMEARLDFLLPWYIF